MIALGLNTVFDAATLSASIGFRNELPLLNLKNAWLPWVARTVDASAFSLTLSWLSPISIGLVMLANHNFGSHAKVRLTWSLDGAVLGSSGEVLVWPVYKGDVQKSSALRSDFTFTLPTNTMIKQLVIEVVQPQVASYSQIGRVFVGEQWVPSLGVEYGAAQLGLVARSSVQTSPSGFRFGASLTPLREVQIGFSALSTTEAIDVLFTAQRNADLLGEVVYVGVIPTWVAVPGFGGALAISRAEYTQCFLANFKEFNPLSQAFFNGYSCSVSLTEVAV